MAIVNEGGATAVVGYVRVSRVGARGGDSFLSPALQREGIARVAAREGLEVVEVVEELDASGGDARRSSASQSARRPIARRKRTCTCGCCI